MLTCMVRALEELMRNETEKENFEKYCLGCACNTPLGSLERDSNLFSITFVYWTGVFIKC